MKWGDKLVNAEPVSFTAIQEPWGEYQLEDGATVRIKTVATHIFRTDQKADDGEPLYIVKSNQIVALHGVERDQK